MDGNIFYDVHLENPRLNWQLKCQKNPGPGDGNIYAETPILRGIIEDTNFSISGSHDWGGMPGGAISNFLTGLMDTVVNTAQDLATSYTTGKAMFNEVNDVITRLSGFNLKNNIQKSFGDSKIFNGVESIANSINDRFSSTKFFSSFDYVKSFRGTQLNFQLPTLQTRLYYGNIPDYLDMNPNSLEDKNSVKNFIMKLAGRISGTLAKFGDTGNNGVDEFARLANEMIGIQTPPNNYQPDFTNIGSSNIIPGTFELDYAGHQIPNLLVESFTINVSTYKVLEKDESGEIIKSKTDEPLYADIMISLLPCTYVSRDLILKVLGINGTGVGATWEKS